MMGRREPTKMGATMDTVVVFVLACLYYWWSMI
jgi:hypothetical protein